METEPAKDRAVGLGALFGVLGLLGAVGMFVAAAVNHDQVASGWAFAFAMTAAGLLVTVLHVYGQTRI